MMMTKYTQNIYDMLEKKDKITCEKVMSILTKRYEYDRSICTGFLVLMNGLPQCELLDDNKVLEKCKHYFIE